MTLQGASDRTFVLELSIGLVFGCVRFVCQMDAGIDRSTDPALPTRDLLGCPFQEFPNDINDCFENSTSQTDHPNSRILRSCGCCFSDWISGLQPLASHVRVPFLSGGHWYGHPFWATPTNLLVPLRMIEG